MPRPKARRSVSLNRAIYDRLRSYCEESAEPMSRTVEVLVSDFLDALQYEPKMGPSSVPPAVVSAPPSISTPEPEGKLLRFTRGPDAPKPEERSADKIFTF